MRTEPAIATWYVGTYLGSADQAQHVRQAVARYLAGCPAAYDAVLIASEFASNAIVHSASRGAFFTVRAELHPDYVWVEAEDLGGSWHCRPPDGRSHGLDVVQALTGPDGWGVETTTSGGRVVWARLDLLPGELAGTASWPNCPVCNARGSRDVSDVSRRQSASVHVPAWLTSVDFMQLIAVWAQGLAGTLLANTLPRRWAHVQGVAAQARSLASSLGPDAGLLEAAAWLHDIGYLPELAATGLHGLDGARYLRDVQHAEPLLCRLVAHHSCAVIEAEERGLADTLNREFAPPPRPLADALTFCDMTTSPDGEHVHVNHRLAEIHDRYGSGHLVSRSIRRATPLILEAVGQVKARAASPRQAAQPRYGVARPSR